MSYLPPVHGYKVAEPLMSQLVRDDIYHTIAVLLIRSILVKQHSGGTIGDEAPFKVQTVPLA